MGEVIDQLRRSGDAFDIEIGDRRLHVSHLDRVMWPEAGVTKRDLLIYYCRVGEFMLPHLRDRPLGFVQYPQGLTGQRKFDRHYWPERTPTWIERAQIFSVDKGLATEHLMINDLASLLWFAQISVYELHPWYSRVTPDPALGSDFASSEAALEASVLNYPDYMVVDLDPHVDDAERGWAMSREVGFRTREVLESLSLQAFPKTSGKSGLHIFVPLKRVYDYDTVRLMAETIAQHMQSLMPDSVTLELRVAKRPAKVFFDYNQNVRAKTLVAAYSTRETAGATVSMPLTWERLATAAPGDFTVYTAPDILAEFGDPWRDIDAHRGAFPAP